MKDKFNTKVIHTNVNNSIPVIITKTVRTKSKSYIVCLCWDRTSTKCIQIHAYNRSATTICLFARLLYKPLVEICSPLKCLIKVLHPVP